MNFMKTYDKTFIDHLGLVHKPVLEPALFQYFPNIVTKNELEGTYEQGFQNKINENLNFF